MKKIASTGALLCMIMQVNAQTLTVDLNTGRTDNWTTYSSWSIPPNQPDSTWMVRVPGSGTYHYATVSTGIDDNYARNFQSIDYGVHMICPDQYVVPSTDTSYPGDLVNLVAEGDYYYRTQFYFDKACNVVSSASLNINLLTGGYTVTDLLINGYSEAIVDSALTITKALSWGLPPAYSIPISSGDLVNGWNYIYVMVNVDHTHHSWGTGLMIDGSLVINYGPAYGIFNTTGSTTSPVCSGQPAYLDVAVGPGQVSSNFNLTITSPSGTLFNGTPPAAITDWPSTTTTYTMTLTNLPCSVVSTSTYVVTVPRHCILRKRTDGVISDEEGMTGDITVMPNPSSGVFSINTGEIESGTISIYDVSGNLIQKTEISGAGEDHRVDLSGFAPGVYMLNVDSENGHFTKKIIRQQ